MLRYLVIFLNSQVFFEFRTKAQKVSARKTGRNFGLVKTKIFRALKEHFPRMNFFKTFCDNAQ